MENQQTTPVANFIKSMAVLAIIGFVFWLTGVIFILVSRLFYRFWRLPTAGEAFWTGFACWWIFAMFLPSANHDDFPNDWKKGEYNNHVGYEYDVTGNKIIFVAPPETYFLPTAYKKLNGGRGGPLTLVGAVDDVNKEFLVKEARTADDLDDIEVCEGEERASGGWVLHRKAHRTASERFNNRIIGGGILMLGVLFFLAAQLKAFLPKEAI